MAAEEPKSEKGTKESSVRYLYLHDKAVAKFRLAMIRFQDMTMMMMTTTKPNRFR